MKRRRASFPLVVGVLCLLSGLGGISVGGVASQGGAVLAAVGGFLAILALVELRSVAS
jgi:hypothetical protein